MTRCNLRSLVPLASCALFVTHMMPARATSCADLAHLALPDTTITLAQPVAAGAFTPPVPEWAKAFMQPKAIPVAFCRVAGTIRPTSDSDIRFEVWLPASGWTGRYESVGNGGFAGSIRYDSMLNPLLGGSVVASTDDGHQAPAIGPTSADWALGHPQKVIDHGYRAVHLTALTAKAISASFYGRQPSHSYFVGCSKGGQEGFMESQRYPDDFDGIVSGAAANEWTNLFTSFMWTQRLNLTDRAAYLAPADLKKIGQAVMAACAAPGDAEHGFISDPLRCKVPLSSIGLTPAKVHTFESIHNGLTDRSGHQVYPGQPYGSEAGWEDTISAANFEAGQTEAQMSMYGANYYRNFVYQDPKWDFHGFEVEKGRADAEKVVGKIMNADDVSFKGFKAHGGRFIQYAGMTDSIVTPLSSVRYYEAVVAAQGGGAAALAKTQEFYRLFLAPGVGHCGGGPGPNQFGQAGGAGDAEHDMVVALERWVEKGVAPAQIIATKFVADDKSKGVAMTRPLCAFPKVAKYKGSGSVSDAASFACVTE